MVGGGEEHDMSSSYRQRRCLRRGEGVGRLSWGVRGSIAAAWDVSGVAMGFGSTTLALAKCIVLRHFPADLGCTKGIRRRTIEARGAQGAVGDISALRHGLLME